MRRRREVLACGRADAVALIDLQCPRFCRVDLQRSKQISSGELQASRCPGETGPILPVQRLRLTSKSCIGPYPVISRSVRRHSKALSDCAHTVCLPRRPSRSATIGAGNAAIRQRRSQVSRTIGPVDASKTRVASAMRHLGSSCLPANVPKP